MGRVHRTALRPFANLTLVQKNCMLHLAQLEVTDVSDSRSDLEGPKRTR